MDQYRVSNLIKNNCVNNLGISNIPGLKDFISLPLYDKDIEQHSNESSVVERTPPPPTSIIDSKSNSATPENDISEIIDQGAENIDRDQVLQIQTSFGSKLKIIESINTLPILSATRSSNNTNFHGKTQIIDNKKNIILTKGTTNDANRIPSDTKNNEERNSSEIIKDKAMVNGIKQNNDNPKTECKVVDNNFHRSNFNANFETNGNLTNLHTILGVQSDQISKDGISTRKVDGYNIRVDDGRIKSTINYNNLLPITNPKDQNNMTTNNTTFINSRNSTYQNRPNFVYTTHTSGDLEENRLTLSSLSRNNQCFEFLVPTSPISFPISNKVANQNDTQNLTDNTSVKCGSLTHTEKVDIGKVVIERNSNDCITRLHKFGKSASENQLSRYQPNDCLSEPIVYYQPDGDNIIRDHYNDGDQYIDHHYDIDCINSNYLDKDTYYGDTDDEKVINELSHDIHTYQNVEKNVVDNQIQSKTLHRYKSSQDLLHIYKNQEILQPNREPMKRSTSNQIFYCQNKTQFPDISSIRLTKSETLYKDKLFQELDLYLIQNKIHPLYINYYELKDILKSLGYLDNEIPYDPVLKYIKTSNIYFNDNIRSNIYSIKNLQEFVTFVMFMNDKFKKIKLLSILRSNKLKINIFFTDSQLTIKNKNINRKRNYSAPKLVSGDDLFNQAKLISRITKKNSISSNTKIFAKNQQNNKGNYDNRREKEVKTKSKGLSKLNNHQNRNISLLKSEFAKNNNTVGKINEPDSNNRRVMKPYAIPNMDITSKKRKLKNSTSNNYQDSNGKTKSLEPLRNPGCFLHRKSCT